MRKEGINPRILKVISELSGEDTIIRDFITEIILDELECDKERWRWRDIYRRKIHKYSEHWEDL